MADMNNIISEIKCLDEYINAMKMVYTTPQLAGDFENLLLHVNNLKVWAGINADTSDSNCNKPLVIKTLPTDVIDYLSLSGALLFDMISDEKINETKERLKKCNDKLLDKYD